MATIRRKKPEPFALLQRDPGPWSPILLYWLATLGVIIVFGLVMLFSASYTTGYLRFGDSLHYIKSQVLCLGLGLVAMFLFSYVDHRLLRRLVWPGYFLVLALLVLVLFSTPLNGCKRWLRVAGMTVQVSEIAKFEMILLTAHLAAKAPHLEKLDPASGRRVPAGQWLYQRIVRELIVPLLPLIPVVFLLMLEPHMSGIVLTTAICGTILLLGGSGGIITWAGGASAVLLLRTVLEHIDSIPYLQSRLDGWTQDLSKMTDQTVQSLYAIGSGGLTGLGLGNSVEKQLWLPESTNDFIFSVVCEELGFVGRGGIGQRPALRHPVWEAELLHDLRHPVQLRVQRLHRLPLRPAGQSGCDHVGEPPDPRPLGTDHPAALRRRPVLRQLRLAEGPISHRRL